MAYPPNFMPGARDVATPYGTMRVNEWGPPDGRKVVFVHGDATPSALWAKIAQGLVDRGCRVLTFDLWGRGYTDTPLNVPHESRLFGMQVLFAITSSTIPWTGGHTFSMVGFSLGGAISLDFASTFPALVDSLVLLGPAGLIRALPEEYNLAIRDPARQPPPEEMRKVVGTMLGVTQTDTPVSHDGPTHVDTATQTNELINWQERDIDVAGLVQWQFDHHHGHVWSFYDTVNHGPLREQQDLWGRACDILAGKTEPASPLHGGSMLVFFGDADGVVVAEETKQDILKLIPEDHVRFKSVPGGHGFPYPNSREITETIADFWGI